MNEAKAKKEVIANSDDKSQITAVLAATITGEHLPRQLIYKGKTTRCSPKVLFPEGWVFGTRTIIGPMRTLWRGSQGLSWTAHLLDSIYSLLQPIYLLDYSFSFTRMLCSVSGSIPNIFIFVISFHHT